MDTKVSDESLPTAIVDRITTNDFFFMQIGANDGISFDPIRRWIVELNWGGIMFEPQPECVRELNALYGATGNIQVAPYGIAPARGAAKLYRHAFGTGTYSMMLRPQHMSADNYLEVECVTFHDAVSMYGIEKIDLLVIDTEGLDLEILATIDLQVIRPRHIWFEKWTHDYDDLTRPTYRTSIHAHPHIIDRFLRAGYRIEDHGTNMFLTTEGQDE